MRKFQKKKFLSLLLVLSILMTGLGMNKVSAKDVEAKSEQEDPETILVKFKPNTPQAAIEESFRRHKARFEKDFEKVGVKKIKVDKNEKKKVLEEYAKDPNVLYVEPDYIAKAFVVTNDPSLSTQWGMFKIQAASSSGSSAWDLVSCGSSTKIAVLDTEIDESHQDLVGDVVARQNFSNSSTNNDVDGHGTHVAGIIAASSNNSLGVAGVAYGAGLMNVKVLGDDGSGSYSSIVNGITWAADNGAKVINMSLGGPNSSIAMQDAVNYAWNKGVVIVAAAGNESTSRASYPAYYSNVIAVAATDNNDAKPSWSNYGSWVDVAAPGASIYSTYAGNKYSTLSGTSMAAPHVAGLAGLVWAKGATSNSDVRSKIESTADKISGTGSNWAFGRINAYKAVGGSTSTPTPTPTPTPVDKTLNIAKIEMSTTPYFSSYKYVNIKVTVVDKDKKPLSGTNVSLTLTLPSKRTTSGTKLTASDGTVTFRLLTTEKGTFSSQVTKLTKSGYTWDGSNNTSSLVVN